MSETTGKADRYLVVVNDEEQYSVWPEDRAAPAGWRPIGVRGSRESCLEHIGRVWTDLRPKTLRLAMGER